MDITLFRSLRDASEAPTGPRGEDILHSACMLAAGGGTASEYLSKLGYPRMGQLTASEPISDVEAMRAVVWMVFNEATGLRSRAEATWTPRLPRIIRLLLGLNPRPSRSQSTRAEQSPIRPSKLSDCVHVLMQTANEVTRLHRENASIAAALAKADYQTPSTMPSDQAVKALNSRMAESLEQYRQEISKIEHLATCEVKFCEWFRSTTVYASDGVATETRKAVVQVVVAVGFV